MKLSGPSVRLLALPPGQRDRTFWDDNIGGFGVRVREGGSKTWIVQYDFGGRTRKIVLGALDTISDAKARSTAKDILAAVRLGRDPAAEKQSAKTKASETFGALLPRYLAHQRAKLKPRSYREVNRHLTQHMRSLHARAVDAVDQRTAAMLLAKLADDGPATANRVRASVSAFYGWLMREGLAASNPFANTNKAPESAPRARTPTDDELREIWQACPDNQYGCIVRLLILTGSRREEIGQLGWSEIDVDNALIVLPPSRVKNSRAHEIPLTAPALAIIKAQPRRTNPNGILRDPVFGRAEGGFQDWGAQKRTLEAAIMAARGENADPMPHWTLHDFRRAMSTTMHERLGIAPHIVEACLGHVGIFRSGVASIYNRSSYRNEKRRALELWAEHLMGIIEGRTGNVVPMKA